MVLCVSLRSVLARTSPQRSQSGKKISTLLDPAFLERSTESGAELLVGLDEDLAGREIDDVGAEAALLDAGVVHRRARSSPSARSPSGRPLVSLMPGEHDLRLPLDAARSARASSSSLRASRRDRQMRPAALEACRHRGVELAQDRLVGLEAEGPQEDRRRELALAVDADVEQVLLVVLELDPRAAVRDDLGEIAVRGFLR